MNPEKNKSTHSKPVFSKEMKIGLLIIIIFFGAFGLWATLAPIESAAIAPGKIITADKRKVIQHLEGGIVKKLYVKEGSLVKQGEPLLVLEDTQAKANYTISQNEFYENLAIEARINAELNDQDKITFPKSLLDNKQQTKVQHAINIQQAIFHSNQKHLQANLKIYQQRIAQLQQEIAGTKAQLQSNTTQLELIKKELKDIKILAEKRLVKQSRLLSLQREEASLQGKRGENIANLAKLKQKIGETQLEMNALVDKHDKELLDELKVSKQKLADLKEKTLAQKDILTRTTIRAPITGKIVGLQAHTIGGVIKPGEVIMDIVPTNKEMIVEAKINPLDIDIVHPGLTAKVRITVFKQRTTPLLLGKVTEVSADSLEDERTGKYYYQAEVSINDNELKKLQGETLYPGMPVEVMIITNRLTPWQYFVDPIKRSFDRAFREE